jgi:hypothetical protein
MAASGVLMLGPRVEICYSGTPTVGPEVLICAAMGLVPRH